MYALKKMKKLKRIRHNRILSAMPWGDRASTSAMRKGSKISSFRGVSPNETMASVHMIIQWKLVENNESKWKGNKAAKY